jgi:hypothetical protein
LIIAMVAIVVIATAIIGYLLTNSKPQPATTAQTTIAGPSTALPPSVESAAPSASPTPTQLPGLAPMVGVWRAHTGVVTIRADGTGHMVYQDFTTCPNCSSADAPAGTVDFTLNKVENGGLTGDVTASSNENIVAVGSPATVELVPGTPSGQQLTLSTGRTGGTYCNDTSVGQCGA